MLERGIGLGYVDIKFSNPGEEITINAKGRELLAKIVPLPFVPNRAR